MSNPKHPHHSISTVSTKAGRRDSDPLDYNHPYESMRRYAELLALRHECPRTRYSYYRAMRLLHEHFGMDPAALQEEHFRDYILHVKTRKHWKPQTIRQTVACARIFFTEMMDRGDWKVFSQIRTRDLDSLPAVLTRDQVVKLLGSIRLRRYRIPAKLIYCAGLRLSECLSLTVHDILGSEGKLMVRGGKGGKDRMVPLAPEMLEDLRRYWKFHRHPLLLFPNAGRGPCAPEKLAARMHRARSPMPHCSLQRLIVVAREELGIRMPPCIPCVIPLRRISSRREPASTPFRPCWGTDCVYQANFRIFRPAWVVGMVAAVDTAFLGMNALKVLSLVGKVAGVVAGLNVIPFVPAKYGLFIFAGASILKDVVSRVGDLVDDGKQNDSFKA